MRLEGNTRNLQIKINNLMTKNQVIRLETPIQMQIIIQSTKASQRV
jgi:hypothetical protein